MRRKVGGPIGLGGAAVLNRVMKLRAEFELGKSCLSLMIVFQPSCLFPPKKSFNFNDELWALECIEWTQQ